MSTRSKARRSRIRTQRPDLYRAVLCRFPDVDILRFNQFTTNNKHAGAARVRRCGGKSEFDAIEQYSPYQNVRPGTAYRAVMLSSGDTAAELAFMMRKLGLAVAPAS